MSEQHIKLERNEHHSRTLNLTGNDTLHEITIAYTGNSNAYKALAIDNEVIPAIINAANSHDDLLEALGLAIEEHPSCIHPACPIKEVGAWCCFVGFARTTLKELEEASK